MSSAIVKVPSERLNPVVVRNIARKNWGLTKEQMCGMHVHHFPPRCEGGKDIPEHLYVCSPEMHHTGWHNEAWFTKNLMKAVAHNTGRKQSKETQEKKRAKLKGRRFGNNIPGSSNDQFNKKVMVDGVIYKSQRDAAAALNISEQCFYYRLKHWGKERGYERV
jgi:hypothetical protein